MGRQTQRRTRKLLAKFTFLDVIQRHSLSVYVSLVAPRSPLSLICESVVMFDTSHSGVGDCGLRRLPVVRHRDAQLVCGVPGMLRSARAGRSNWCGSPPVGLGPSKLTFHTHVVQRKVLAISSRPPWDQGRMVSTLRSFLLLPNTHWDEQQMVRQSPCCTNARGTYTCELQESGDLEQASVGAVADGEAVPRCSSCKHSHIHDALTAQPLSRGSKSKSAPLNVLPLPPSGNCDGPPLPPTHTRPHRHASNNTRTHHVMFCVGLAILLCSMREA
jgi:hypothetical protein